MVAIGPRGFNWLLTGSSYTSVRFNSVSLSDIEYFERSMNHNTFSHTK